MKSPFEISFKQKLVIAIVAGLIMGLLHRIFF